MSSMNSEFLHYDKNNNQNSNVDSSWNTGNMNGKMKLTELRGKQFSRLRRQSIELTVYHSQAAHFVVIHSNSSPVGVLKLKNTTVESLNGNSFQVREIGCDNSAALTFVLDLPQDLDYWMIAFTYNISPSTYKSDLMNIMELDQEEYYQA